MGFKLVRTDTEDPSKILLEVGTHFIGRGKLLNCDDKRVSRNHGMLEVSDETVQIKALHQNPCFFIKNNDPSDRQVLQQNCTVNLSNGDKFGLLPNSYWYEVLHCKTSDNQEDSEGTKNHLIEDNGVVKVGNVTDQVNDSDDTCNENELESEDAESKTLLVSDLNKPVENVAPSPSILREDEQLPTENNQVDQPSTENYQLDQPSTVSSSEHLISNAKRCHSLEDDSNNEELSKRLKIKLEDVEQESEEAKPGPSCDSQVSKDVSDKNPSGEGSSNKQINGPGRERCIYGANCYRRNPQHKAQFSHPQDPDWGAGERGICPWGRSCRRRDQRHWLHNEHPPGVVRPDFNAAAGKRRKERKNKRINSTEDYPDENLIVLGKRARKTVKKLDWSESELDSSDEDPYQTDGSEDWEPPSQSTETQDTQDF